MNPTSAILPPMLIQTGNNNPILRTVSAPISAEEIRKYRKFAQKLVDYVCEPKNGSCGLAAPQAGKNIRLVAVAFLKNWDDEDAPIEALFNPEILEKSPEVTTEKEGCLSLPKYAGLVTRPFSIRLRWQDMLGKTHEKFLEGTSARIVQHEIDHLEGILFMDKALPTVSDSGQSETVS